jgi:hypothetical protein
MKKKILAMVLSMAMLLTAVPMATVSANTAVVPFSMGDVNGDGIVTVQDALQILRYLVGLSSVLNGNQSFPQGVTGTIENALRAARIFDLRAERPTVQDALQILRYLVGLSNFIDGSASRPRVYCDDCRSFECSCNQETIYVDVFVANEMELRGAVVNAGTTPTAIHLTADIGLFSNLEIPNNSNIKLTSDGTPYSLSATRNMDVIDVGRATLVLEHITITRAEGTSGGGLMLDNSTVIINSGRISGNTDMGINAARSSGGSISIVSSSTVVMNGGEVVDNNGGGIRTYDFTMHGGKIANNNGDGVYTITLTMYGGEITENRGMGVYVWMGGGFGGGTLGGASPSEVFIHGGKISDNGGSGVSIQRGIFVMNGGTISGNNRGGVNFSSVMDSRNRDTFTMNGGEIINNTSTGEGGGIRFISGSLDYRVNVTINGGKISGNTANEGGGVFVGRGVQLIMNGGEINNNTSNRSGGGVFLKCETNVSASLTMNGGEISGNTTENNGGGVFVDFTRNLLTGNITNSAIITMTGGRIHNNTATIGGGVHVERGPFRLEGGWIFNNHSNNSADNNAYISQSATFGNDVFDPNVGGLGITPPR